MKQILNRLYRKYLLFFVAAAAAHTVWCDDVEIKKIRWGFDGTVIQDRVNPLSVFIKNSGTEVFDGQLVLFRTLNMGERTGARMTEPCFLSPGAARWIQFYIVPGAERDTWHLEWGKGRDQKKDIREPRHGPPARVQFISGREPGRPAGRLPVFEEYLFPPSVSAADGLGSAVLDHMPVWEKARSRAFADWLRRGGAVHICWSGHGKFPRFTGELACLNRTSERFRVGAGLAVRHSTTRSRISEKFLNVKGFERIKREDYDEEWHSYEDFNSSILRILGEIVIPEFNWPLIYTLAVCFLVTVVPVNYMISRKVRSYAVTIGVYLGSVAVFSMLFIFLGRRGAGEESSVYSLAYARHISGPRFDVAQWSNLFVTDGDYYDFERKTFSVYSTCQRMEEVRGIIQNGSPSRFFVDIPRYSRRGLFVKKTVDADADGSGVSVTDYEENDSFIRMTVRGADPFLNKDSRIRGFYKGVSYSFKTDGDNLVLMPGSAKKQHNMFIGSDADFPNSMYMGADEKRDPDEVFGDLYLPLLKNCSGAGHSYACCTEQVRSDALQLFIYSSYPDSLKGDFKQIGDERGYILYHFILPVKKEEI